MRIFHLATVESWRDAQAAGTYRVSTIGRDLDEVGFIHCSQVEQLAGVHAKHYRDVTEPIVLLTIDTDLLTSAWRLDDVPGEPLPYPHVYGPINLDAVVETGPYGT